MPFEPTIGERVRFTDTAGKERTGTVRDATFSRLTWKGKVSYLVHDGSAGLGEQAFWWVKEVRPDKD